MKDRRSGASFSLPETEKAATSGEPDLKPVLKTSLVGPSEFLQQMIKVLRIVERADSVADVAADNEI